MEFSDFQEIFEKMEKVHPNLFYQLPQQQFEKEMERVKENWENLNEYDQIYETLRLRAMLGDAHLWINFNRPERAYPFCVKKLKEGFCVVDLDSKLMPEDALNTKILAINKIPITEIVEIMSPIISTEKGAFNMEVESFLAHCLYYKVLGISKDGKITLTLQNNGKTFDVAVKPIPKGHKIKYLKEPSKNCTFEEKDDYFYLKINRFKWERGLHLNKLYAYLALATESKKPIIVDVRDNHGGGIKKMDVWSDIMSKNNAKGFCLMNHNSFSASVFAAQKLKKMGFTLVGESAGQMATFYGGVNGPNVTLNGILVTTPTRKVDADSKRYSRNNYYSKVFTEDEPLKPDVFIEESLEDLKKGKDRALEFCVEEIKKNNQHSKENFEFEEIELCP